MSELKHQNSEIYPRKTPDCRYDVARQEWDRRIGSKVVLIAQLKIAIIVVFIFAVSACCVAWYYANRSVVLPYIVQVDSKTGAVITVDKLAEQTKPNAAGVEYFVWRILKNTRTIPKDIIVYRNNWQEVYTFLDTQTSQKFNDMAIRENHKEKIENGKTSTLMLKNITPLAGKEDTYNVRWQEIHYGRDGKKEGEYELEAYFTVNFVTPQAESIHINPYGLRITDFSISQER